MKKGGTHRAIARGVTTAHAAGLRARSARARTGAQRRVAAALRQRERRVRRPRWRCWGRRRWLPTGLTPPRQRGGDGRRAGRHSASSQRRRPSTSRSPRATGTSADGASPRARRSARAMQRATVATRAHRRRTHHARRSAAPPRLSTVAGLQSRRCAGGVETEAPWYLYAVAGGVDTSAPHSAACGATSGGAPASRRSPPACAPRRRPPGDAPRGLRSRSGCCCGCSVAVSRHFAPQTSPRAARRDAAAARLAPVARGLLVSIERLELRAARAVADAARVGEALRGVAGAARADLRDAGAAGDRKQGGSGRAPPTRPRRGVLRAWQLQRCT